MVHEFRGKYHFLSNFYVTPVMYKDTLYPSSEHAYMSAKSTDPVWKSYCSNNNISPGNVKRESKHIKLVDNWDRIKLIVMEDVLRSKFENVHMKKLLLETGNQNLQEGNYWNDKFWGVDLKESPNMGENNLGRLLMKIRDELKNKETISTILRILDTN